MGKVTDQASQPIGLTRASMQKVQGDRAAAASARSASLKEQKAVAKQAEKSEAKKAQERRGNEKIDCHRCGTWGLRTWK
ncbi:MAG TPA: hypothetical protein VHY08_00410 [Bacillota bacterium]|nr:hypothetical protein [Bacillota bacterium]